MMSAKKLAALLIVGCCAFQASSISTKGHHRGHQLADRQQEPRQGTLELHRPGSKEELSLSVSLLHAGSVPKAHHKCTSDLECGWHAACDDELKTCASKPLGADLRADVLMCVLAFFVAAISLAAGVGGGGMNVPLLMAVLSFDAHVATAMSQAMLFGGASAAFVYNYAGSHPSCPQRPLINYELASLIGASVVAGAQVGSVIHASAPPALILILLVAVLCDAARKGVNNARKISAKEAEAKDTPAAPGAPGDSEDPASDPHIPQIMERSKEAQKRLGIFWALCLAVSRSL